MPLTVFAILLAALLYTINVHGADEAESDKSIRFYDAPLEDSGGEEDQKGDDDRDDGNKRPGGWKNLPQTGQTGGATLPLLGSLLLSGSTITLIYATQGNKLVTMLEN